MILSSIRRLTFCSKRSHKVLEIWSHIISKRNVTWYNKQYDVRGTVLRTKFSRYFTSNSHFDNEDFVYEFEGAVHKSTKKEAMQRLSNCLGCSESEAMTILKDFPKLKNLTSNNIQNKLQFYDNLGIELKEVIQNPWLLWFKSSVIESKIKILAELGINDIRAATPLLGVTLKRLKELKQWSEGAFKENKIAYISKQLECDPADVGYVFSTHKFIERLPFDRLIGIIELLLDAGVLPEDILRDIWVLRYNKAQVADRIMRAKEGGIVQFKPWMVRCTEKVFSNTLRRHSEKRALLGPHKDSAIEYISSRLGVSHTEAGLILSRLPQLRGVGAAKLCNTLDFLLGKESRISNPDAMEKSLTKKNDLENPANFDRMQVWMSIRALCYSLDTMKERLSRLRALGYEPYCPSVLYQSRRKFEEFVKKLEEKASPSSDNMAEVEKINGKENTESRSGSTG